MASWGTPNPSQGFVGRGTHPHPVNKIQLHPYSLGLGFFSPSFPPGSDFVIGSLYPGWQRAGIREQNNARQGGQRGVAVLSISKNTSSLPDATKPPTRPLPASTSATSPSNCCWEPGGDKEMGDSFSLLVDLGCWHGETGRKFPKWIVEG